MNDRPLYPGQIQNWQAVALLHGWDEDYQEGRELLVAMGVSPLDVKRRYFSRIADLQNCGVVAVELRKWDGDHFGGRWIPAGKLDASKIAQEVSAA